MNLRKCPFCNSEAVDTDLGISCIKCGANMPDKYMKRKPFTWHERKRRAYHQAWDKRPIENATIELCELLLVAMKVEEGNLRKNVNTIQELAQQILGQVKI